MLTISISVGGVGGVGLSQIAGHLYVISAIDFYTPNLYKVVYIFHI